VNDLLLSFSTPTIYLFKSCLKSVYLVIRCTVPMSPSNHLRHRFGPFCSTAVCIINVCNCVCMLPHSALYEMSPSTVTWCIKFKTVHIFSQEKSKGYLCIYLQVSFHLRHVCFYLTVRINNLSHKVMYLTNLLWWRRHGPLTTLNTFSIKSVLSS